MRKATAKGSVAIDTVPLPDHTVRGVITKDGKEFVLKVGKRRVKLTPGPLASRQQLSALVNKDVAVALSRKDKREIVAIGTWPTPERRLRKGGWIVCYIPAPDMMKRVDPYVRSEMLFALEKEGVITTEVADLVRHGMRGF
jgi:hypothetical protein